MAFSSGKKSTRATVVTALTCCCVTFSAWTWGGIVLWTQWVFAGLGLLTLAISLLPDAPCSPAAPRFLPRVLGASLGLGLLVAAYLIWVDLDLVLTQRAAAQELLPGLHADPLRFSQWGLRGLLAGVFTSLVALIVSGLASPSESRRRLARFLPFWLGLFLFAWIACQSWNTWGVVVQRDLFWRILPRDHIIWLPSGLDAPFYSKEEPGGMNGWRQLLILVGPWAILCALLAARLSRGAYMWIAGAASANGIGVAIVGNVYRANNWKGFLGIDDPDLRMSPFGPFVYKNHAGAFLYLSAGLTLALMFHLLKLRGERADKGGPHLLVALAFIFLFLGAASTMSTGALLASCALLLLAPLAYLCDKRLRDDLSPFSAGTMAALTAIVLAAGLFSADAQRLRDKIGRKMETLKATGTDDRAPLRRATWLMVESSEWPRQLSGWGAGSYRWISPGFLRTQPEFLNRKGELNSRATHAHNDWMQSTVEWGAAGWIVTFGTAWFLLSLILAAGSSPKAVSIVLAGTSVLFAAHAALDFLLFIPNMTLLAIVITWFCAAHVPDRADTRANPVA